MPRATGSRCGPAARGLTQRANDAIAELRKADDWGLRAADYDVPTVDSAASFEMLADAEIKIGLAVLKYGRHARGGRLDPGSVSKLFDQDPPVYDPKSLIAARRRRRSDRCLPAPAASAASAVRAAASGHAGGARREATGQSRARAHSVRAAAQSPASRTPTSRCCASV